MSTRKYIRVFFALLIFLMNLILANCLVLKEIAIKTVNTIDILSPHCGNTVLNNSSELLGKAKVSMPIRSESRNIRG